MRIPTVWVGEASDVVSHDKPPAVVERRTSMTKTSPAVCSQMPCGLLSDALRSAQIAHAYGCGLLSDTIQSAV